MATATEDAFRQNLVQRLVPIPVLIVLVLTVFHAALWAATLVLVAVVAAGELLVLVGRRYRTPRQLAALTLMGAIVLAGLCVAYVLRGDTPDGLIYLLVAIFIGVSTDATAYFWSKTHGVKGTFFPRISPNKSREGALFSIICCAIVGFIVAFASAQVFGRAIDLAAFCVMATLLPIVATAGDLTASWVKRVVGTKDYGRSIPGHGGVIDRLDSLAVSAIWAWSFYAYGLTAWQLIIVLLIAGVYEDNTTWYRGR